MITGSCHTGTLLRSIFVRPKLVSEIMRYVLPLLFSAVVLFTGCKKDDPAPTTTSSGTGGTSPLTASTALGVTMTIDGSTVSFPVGSLNTLDNSASGDIVAPPDSSLKGYSVYINESSNGETRFACDLGRYRFLGTSPSDAQFFSFFSTGNIPYGNWEMELNKVGITYWTTDGTEYSTYWSADHPGETFTITEVLEQPSVGVSTLKMRVSFNCKLYHENGSGSFVTAVGTAVLSYQNI